MQLLVTSRSRCSLLPAAQKHAANIVVKLSTQYTIVHHQNVYVSHIHEGQVVI